MHKNLVNVALTLTKHSTAEQHILIKNTRNCKQRITKKNHQTMPVGCEYKKNSTRDALFQSHHVLITLLSTQQYIFVQYWMKMWVKVIKKSSLPFEVVCWLLRQKFDYTRFSLFSNNIKLIWFYYSRCRSTTSLSLQISYVH